MKQSRRGFLAGAAAVVSFVAVPAHGAAPTVIGGPAFGSYWRISMDRSADTAAVRRRVEAIIESVNTTFSPYRGESELTAFNRHDTTNWTPASSEFRWVLGRALRISEQTSGAFDPTVGPLVGRYGFGPIRGHSDGDRLNLEVGAEAVRKDDARIAIDLCGIAKGHALDRMCHALDDLGIGDFLIELGGEVASRGRQPAGRAWQVAIEQPTTSGTTLGPVIVLEGKSVATSGVSRNSYTIAGRHYSHIIDARRRAPATGDVLSASVIAKSATDADALATALVAMHRAEALSFATRHGIDALLHLRNADASRIMMTGRFAESLIR